MKKKKKKSAALEPLSLEEIPGIKLNLELPNINLDLSDVKLEPLPEIGLDLPEIKQGPLPEIDLDTLKLQDPLMEGSWKARNSRKRQRRAR